MNERTRALCLSALSAAAGTVLLYVGSLLPSGRLVMIFAAGLGVAAVLLCCSWKWALSCYVVTGTLSLLLCPEKGLPLAFLLLLGYYPIVKLYIERMSGKPKRWVLKLGLFNLVWVASVLFLRAWIPEELVAGWTTTALLVGGNGLFLMYDFALQQCMLYFLRNIARRIR